MLNQRYQFYLLLFIIFVSFIGVSIPYPIFPPLFIDSGGDFGLLNGWAPHSRSFFLGVALAVYPLGQFLGGPILGALSDRYGRKKILVFSLAGSVGGYLLTLISLESASLGLLIASRFFTGVLESNLGVVRAMASDFKSIDRYKSIGSVNAVAAIGYVIGPLLGGIFSDSALFSWFSPKIPFYIAFFLSVITWILAVFFLPRMASPVSIKGQKINIWECLRLFDRMKRLMKNRRLKYLLIISSTLTLAIDIFYEFGPIYLTGRWLLPSTGLAIYNGVLSLALAFGNGWLSHRLSRSFAPERNVKISILLTAFFLLMVVISPDKHLVLLLFGFMGFSIAVAVNTVTVEISHESDPSIQGEVMGTQFGLRMLGDAVVCLIGGLLIIASWVLPLIMASAIALVAFGMYSAYLKMVEKTP